VVLDVGSTTGVRLHPRSDRASDPEADRCLAAHPQGPHPRPRSAHRCQSAPPGELGQRTSPTPPAASTSTRPTASRRPPPAARDERRGRTSSDVFAAWPHDQLPVYGKTGTAERGLKRDRAGTSPTCRTRRDDRRCHDGPGGRLRRRHGSGDRVSKAGQALQAESALLPGQRRLTVNDSAGAAAYRPASRVAEYGSGDQHRRADRHTLVERDACAARGLTCDQGPARHARGTITAAQHSTFTDAPQPCVAIRGESVSSGGGRGRLRAAARPAAAWRAVQRSRSSRARRRRARPSRRASRRSPSRRSRG
jgi:hypothetical protein